MSPLQWYLLAATAATGMAVAVWVIRTLCDLAVRAEGEHCSAIAEALSILERYSPAELAVATYTKRRIASAIRAREHHRREPAPDPQEPASFRSARQLVRVGGRT